MVKRDVQISHRSLRYFFLLGVVLISLSVFWPALSGGFIFDDYAVFVENPIAHVQGGHWQAWWSLWRWSAANIQRPLAMASYAINYAVGSGTEGFKATNLGIHVVNILLVFLLSQRLLTTAWTMLEGIPPLEKGRSIDYWALGVTAAWGLHPLHVSTVMYVVQRMELMGFTFVLLALLAYWHGRNQQQQGRLGWPWLLLCGGITGLGFFAKETVALVPGYALLLELTLLGFSASSPIIQRNWRFTYIVGCLMGVAVFFVYVIPHSAPTYFVMRNYTAGQRELTQLRALTMYLGWILLPLPNQLHFYYDNYPVSTGFFQPITTLISAIFLLGLLALALFFRRRRPLLALGIAWFFLAHLITSSPLPLELVFEHRNYPALFGIVLALADVIWMLRHRMKSIFPAVLALVFIANLAYLTALRAATWGSPFQLATTLAQTNPGSPRAALDLARRYVAMSGDTPGTPFYSMGIQELERAAQLPTSSILPEDALLIQATKDSSLDSSVWWASLQRKLKDRPLSPETYLALHGLWQACLENCSRINARQLARSYEIIVARNPSRLSLRVEYAELASRTLNDQALAITQWQQAIDIQKGAPEYTEQLSAYLISNHRPSEALAVLNEATDLQPPLRNEVTISMLRSQATAMASQEHITPR